jgi:hypothetical protein
MHLPIAMKSILAIFAIGLMLATAMGGCVGSEQGNDATNEGTGDNISGTGNETGNATGNETGGNATGNATIPENYHKEYQDDMVFMDMPSHEFPVKAGAKKAVLKFVVETTIPMDPTQQFALDIMINNPKGEEYQDLFVLTGEYVVEISESDLASNGYGKWTIEMFDFEPSASCATTIDVFYQ